jgi:methyltransferase (TIGR00027 family)
MKSGTPSRTSEGTTAVRAREMRKPAAERICHDPYAEHFLGPFHLALRRYPWIARPYGWFKEWSCPGLRGGILARTRFIDERVMAALAEGVEQLVILGAGYDSRGYRLIEPCHGTAVYEVDHPATQQAKVSKVREVLGAPPAHVSFVPIDFCRDNMAQRLAEAGYRRDKKTLFIWEGVIYYLPASAVEASLAFVAQNSGSGSSIVFDYFPRAVIDGSFPGKEARSLARFVEKLGEPFIFGIDDDEIEQFLRDRGFEEIEVTTSKACKEAWFTGSNAKMNVSEMFRFVHARHFC